MTNKPGYPTCKTLAFMLSRRESYRPTLFSQNEVFCGPDCKTNYVDNILTTLQTPVGIFNAELIYNELSSAQRPDIIIVKADGTQRNFPINLSTFNCVRILIVGDTHHQKAPIQSLLEYAVQEKFDYIVSDHDGHHLHFFLDAGFKNVGFIPAINTVSFRQPWKKQRKFIVSFVGQVGRFHPYRRHILNTIKKNGVEINQLQVPQNRAAEIYADSLINLNISLNGDLNLRFFEVISSGGFLLTDRLSQESGIYNFFKEGEHFEMFDDAHDLKEKIKYYSDHPASALKIAKQGQMEFEKNHAPESKAQALINFALTGKIEQEYTVSYDKRCFAVPDSPGHELLARVKHYELIQELHLNAPHLNILFWPEVNKNLISDLADLPRIKIVMKTETLPSEQSVFFHKTGILDRVHLIENQNYNEEYFHIIILPHDNLLNLDLEQFLLNYDFSHLIISDVFDNSFFNKGNEYNQLLESLGFTLVNEDPPHYTWENKILWGEYLFSENKLLEAKAHFERIKKYNKNDPELQNNIGVLYFKECNYALAEKYFIQSVGHNRRSINYLSNYALSLFNQKKFKEAIDIYNELISITSNDATSILYLAKCYKEIEDLENSLKYIEKTLSIDPQNQDANSLLNEVSQFIEDGKGKIKHNACNPNIHQSKTQRILIINNLYPPQELGGYGRLLYDFTTILSERGHQTHVLTSDTEYLGQADTNEEHIDRRLMLFGEWKDGKTNAIEDKNEIWKLINANNKVLHDTINCFNPTCVLLGNIDFLGFPLLNEILKHNIPIIHHIGNANPGYQPNQTPTSVLYHLATASKWVSKNLSKNGFKFPTTSTIYPGARVHDFFMKTMPTVDSLRIAYASIVLPYKGAHVLVMALNILHERGINFKCEVAGPSTDSAFLNQLQQYIKTQGFDNKVDFLGLLNREQLKDLYGRSNILVFPSVFEEPFGISQVEAMASGLAVITSGTGGTKEIIQRDKSGIIFKTESAESLAEKLISLSSNKKQWKKIARNGQKRALNKFDINSSVDIIEKQFHKMTMAKRTEK